MGCVFLILCVPDNFCLDAKYVSFTLLDAGDFCPPTNLLELCSGMQLTYLEAI